MVATLRIWRPHSYQKMNGMKSCLKSNKPGWITDFKKTRWQNTKNKSISSKTLSSCTKTQQLKHSLTPTTATCTAVTSVLRQVLTLKAFFHAWTLSAHAKSQLILKLSLKMISWPECLKEKSCTLMIVIRHVLRLAKEWKDIYRWNTSICAWRKDVIVVNLKDKK